MAADFVARHDQISGADTAADGALIAVPEWVTPRGRIAMIALTVCWGAIILATTAIHLTKYGHHVAVFAHVMSLVLGFGAVLAIDVCGLAAVLGRRSLVFAARVAATVDPMLWLGCLGLGLSGLFLEPKLGDVLLWVKLLAVLVAVLNGVNARVVMSAMVNVPEQTKLSDLPRAFMMRVLSAALISQVAWWTALTIGYFGEVSHK
jgi:hypothetical protein